jgi:hypothetical protein
VGGGNCGTYYNGGKGISKEYNYIKSKKRDERIKPKTIGEDTFKGGKTFIYDENGRKPICRV